jgi:hypothetical protein
MKYLVLSLLFMFSMRIRAQGDKNLDASVNDNLPFVMGIVIAVIVIIAIYILLRKEDK